MSTSTYIKHTGNPYATVINTAMHHLIFHWKPPVESDRWGINSWKDYRHILWGNIRPICMYTNPNCKYNNVKTRRRPCMAKLMAGWLLFFILFSGLWAPPSNSGLKKQQAGDTPAGARNFEKHLTRFGYWPRLPRRRSTAACTFPAVATSAWMFSALSMKPISRSWVSCVAYSSSGGTEMRSSLMITKPRNNHPYISTQVFQ